MLATFVGIALACLPLQQDREVSRLTKQALDRDPVESRTAIEHLAAFGERGVPGLGEVIERGKLLSRAFALVEVTKLGPSASAILPALADCLPAAAPAPSADLPQAMDDQRRAGKAAARTVSFEKALSDWSGAAWDARELEAGEPALAAEALAAVAPADLAAALEACLAESKRGRYVRAGYESALVALARAAAEPGEGQVEALLPYVNHKDALARHLALAAIASAGRHAEIAREAVVEALGDRDRAIAARAAEALMWVQGDGAMLGPLLAPLAESSDGHLAVHAARAWWSVCPEDPAPRAALRARLSDRDEEVRATAIVGLARLVREPEDADLAAFVEAFADRKAIVRLAAAKAARNAADRFGALRPALATASMDEDDPAVAQAMAEALKEMR